MKIVFLIKLVIDIYQGIWLIIIWKNSKIYLTCYDENESYIDFVILQRVAFYNEFNIIKYESNPFRYYVEGKRKFGVTLILEQTCNLLTICID